MRTRLRANSRGNDYLPKEARAEPNAYARSFRKRAERCSSRSSSTTTTNSNNDSDSDNSPDESINQRLHDIKLYKEAVRRRPFGAFRLISPAVVFPRHRHTETLMSTNPSPTPPTSSQEPTPDFLSGPNDVCPIGSGRFSENSAAYGKIIFSLKNLDNEEIVSKSQCPSALKYLMKTEVKTDIAGTSSGKSYKEKAQQTIPQIKLEKAATVDKSGIKRKSVSKVHKRKSTGVVTNKSKHVSKSAHKILKVDAAILAKASTSGSPLMPTVNVEPPPPEEPTAAVQKMETQDVTPGPSQQPDDQVQSEPCKVEASSEPAESVDNVTDSIPLEPVESQQAQEEPTNQQQADAYSDISTEDVQMEEVQGVQAEFSQFGDVNSTSEGGVTELDEIQPLEEYQGNEAVASTSRASPNYEPMDSRQGMALQRPSAYVLPSTSRENSNGPVPLLTNEDNWQQQATAVIIRDKMILEHQKWTDVVFFIGPNQQKFRAHKVYLAKSSVVFEHLLYGRTSTNEIHFPDMTSESFASLLQFIYEGELHLSSLKEACNMLQLAKRFRLDDSVVSRCRSYIFVRIFPSSAWEVVSFAFEKDEPQLFETAVKACRKLLDEDNILTASRDLLLAMFENDALHEGVDAELSLYKACTKWANHQMTVNSVSDEEIKNLITPLLYQIRFLNMTLTDCIQVCDQRPSILSDAEKLALMCFRANPQERAMPEFVSPKFEDESNVNTTFFVYAMPHEDTDYALDLDINTYNQFSTSAFEINGESDDKTVNYIQIPTQLNLDNPSDTYNEDLTLSFKDNTRPGLLHVAHYTQLVRYNSYTNIELASPIPLKDIPSKIIEVRIIFHTTGRYPATKDIQLDLLNRITENDPREIYYYNAGKNFMHLMGYRA